MSRYFGTSEKFWYLANLVSLENSEYSEVSPGPKRPVSSVIDPASPGSPVSGSTGLQSREPSPRSLIMLVSGSRSVVLCTKAHESCIDTVSNSTHRTSRLSAPTGPLIYISIIGSERDNVNIYPVVNNTGGLIIQGIG